MPTESLNAPARFIEPLAPEVVTNGSKPFYLLQTPLLIATTSLLQQRLPAAELKLLPRAKRTSEFPYRERWGTGSYSCCVDEISNDPTNCSMCTPAVALDPGPPRILEHIGAHVLFDDMVNRLDEPCGLCLLPSKSCRYVVVKGKGSKASLHVDWDRTSCTNVPLVCPLCPKSEPAVWRYNFRYHLERVHSAEAVTRYSSLWKLSDNEMLGMRHIISEAHSSIAPLHR